MDQEFINELAEKLSKLGTKRPLGFHYAHPFCTVPPDSIQCNGAEYNRSLYSDFFAYATEQGWVKTEAEWQEIASQNNGYCSYYSDGDGSTTFRTPKFAPFMQIAIASGNVGNYHEAGIPNITGTTSAMRGGTSGFTRATGAFNNSSLAVNSEKLTGGGYVSSSSSPTDTIETFDASRESEVYGKSETVQPESHEWMICVVVFGIATNVGSTDVGNVMSAVAQVQANPNLQGQAHIVETWKSDSSWYRVWSDGFKECWGKAEPATSPNEQSVTFPLSFSNVPLVYQTDNSGPYTKATTLCYIQAYNVTTTGFTTYRKAENILAAIKSYYACGY